MKTCRGGAKYYTFGVINGLKVSFPENRVSCSECDFARHWEAFGRYECILTHERIMYPYDGVGNECPIELDNERCDE